jgi:cysteinyl-tRNA synthetase
VTLRLTNTLTRTCEDFVPLNDRRVTIYCCGVTVYDLCHVGHARSYLVWDVLRRYLIWSGYAVTYVQNFTDIDDKILARAAREGASIDTITERNISAYFQDMDALNILRPDRMPRATQCLDGIRALIAELEARGAAYSVDGDVYFAVLKQADYGKLSGRDLSSQRDDASGRLSEAEEARKHNPFDFALWKGAKPGEPSYPSPWGAGRPGWHIECSAMVRQELGDTIDIHLGGADLIFPHHENEIAQSEAATGKPLARYWLHNGMVNVGGEKMSKSLGNFTTIRALLESGISPMALRLFVLQAHYRKPLDFTQAGLNAASKGWERLRAALDVGNRLGWSTSMTSTSAPALPDELKASRSRFIAAMDDDLNTSAALAEIFDLAKPLRGLAGRLQSGEVATTEEIVHLESRWRLLVELSTEVLGLTRISGALHLDDPDIRNYRVHVSPVETSAAYGEREARGPEDRELETELIVWELLKARHHAKSAKNYVLADQLRDKLLGEYGVAIYDKAAGVTTANGGGLRQIVIFDPSNIRIRD